jgi:putative transposase
MEETVRYTYRLRPGARARTALLAEWGRCRWLWNEAVNQQRSKRKPTRAKLGRLLTEARGRNAWLRDGSQNAQQQMLQSYAGALDQSFKVKGRGRPKIKRKRETLPSLEYTRNGFKVAGGHLKLPKGVSAPVVWSRELPGDPTSCRVHLDGLGHWYVSFVVRREAVPAPAATGGIGIDWGVKATATTTDPDYDLPYAGNRKMRATQMARAQRKMARRRRPRGHGQSSGYKTARRQMARIARKAARRNTHEARQWAKRVVDDHDLIAVEDFKPKFLAKSNMAGAAADAAIGATKRELIERGKRAGRRVVLVPPAYTTMTCSDCGARAKTRLSLSERTFVCLSCGYTSDRDVNAARNILATAERGRAGADDVRRDDAPLVGVGVSRSEPEIPRL